MNVELEVAVSDQLREIDQAMVLVHDGFVESGYMHPEPSGRRAIPHYLTPGAFFVLAYLRGTAIGACAVVPDGPWGLPSAHTFGPEIEGARAAGSLVEVGSLVVALEHRALTRQVFMQIVAAVIRILSARGDDPVPLITVAPEQERFYNALFGFVRTGPQRMLYGAPAVAMAVRISDLVEHVCGGQTIARRTMAGLITDPEPRWLENRLLDRTPHPVRPPAALSGAGGLT